MAGHKLPQPTAILIRRVRRTAQYLDALAARIDARDPNAYAVARAHANTCWQAVGRLEDLAELVDELAPPFGEPVTDPGRAEPDDDDALTGGWKL
jgi:hypothetical protein